jgi:hypothetical protein
MTTSESQRVNELYEFGPFRVDAARETLLRAGEPVPLTPKTFQILLVLVRHGKEIVTKDGLMKAVWPDTFVEEANLSRNIFMLRKALGETAQDTCTSLQCPDEDTGSLKMCIWFPSKSSRSLRPAIPRCRCTSKRLGGDRGSWRPWFSCLSSLSAHGGGFCIAECF